jgi:hypothetical protein
MTLLPSIQALGRSVEKWWWSTCRNLPTAALRPLAPVMVLSGLLVVTVTASCVSEPHTMVSATVNTEYASTRVVSPQDGAFRLAAARIDDTCVRDVFIEPATGAVVALTRPAKGELVVDVIGDSAWHSPYHQNDARQTRERHLRLVVSNDCDCASGRSVRLPFKGLATIGADLQEVTSDFEKPQLALLSGQLAIYGRSIIDLNFGPFQARALYLSQTLPVPAGSRIAAARRDKPSSAAAGPAAKYEGDISPWYGFVDADFDAEGSSGLTVEASTNARFVEIYPPAPFRIEGEVHGSRPDVVSLSLAARLSGDPNLVWLLGVLTVVGGLFAWGLNLLGAARR